jgi:hypothetical protein
MHIGMHVVIRSPAADRTSRDTRLSTCCRYAVAVWHSCGSLYAAVRLTLRGDDRTMHLCGRFQAGNGSGAALAGARHRPQLASSKAGQLQSRRLATQAWTRPSLEPVGAAIMASVLALSLGTAAADELTLRFKASDDPDIRAAQTRLVQTYGAQDTAIGACH